MSESDASYQSQSGADFPPPPATFEFLVLSLKMQAEMSMGQSPFGTGGEPMEPDFAHARHAIDLLAMLQDKTKGNLDISEKLLLENALTELRFRYVQSLEANRKKAAEAAEKAKEAAEKPVEAAAAEAAGSADEDAGDAGMAAGGN